MDQPVPASITPPINSTGIDQLAAALSAAQGKFVAPKKTRKVDFTDRNGRQVKYNYADLADVIECTKGPLAENGLAIVHTIGYMHGMFGLATRLIHKSGQFVDSWYPLPDPNKNQIRAQEFGSALTYGRRYSMSALLGVASEEDDDGSSAAPTEPPQRQKARHLPPVQKKPDPSKPPVKQSPGRDNSPASEELYQLISAECGNRQIGQDKIAYLVRKGFGLDPSQNIPTWVAQDILKTISNEDCTEATVIARAEILKNARVARGLVDKSESSPPPAETEQEAFNRQMQEHVGMSEPEPAHPGDQVSKDPIDKTFETYVIPTGKWNGKTIRDLGVLEARKYLEFMESAAKKDGKQLAGWQQEFKFHFEHFAAHLARGGK